VFCLLKMINNNKNNRILGINLKFLEKIGENSLNPVANIYCRKM